MCGAAMQRLDARGPYWPQRQQQRHRHPSAPTEATRSTSALGLLRQNQQPSTGLTTRAAAALPLLAASMSSERPSSSASVGRGEVEGGRAVLRTQGSACSAAVPAARTPQPASPAGNSREPVSWHARSIASVLSNCTWQNALRRPAGDEEKGTNVIKQPSAGNACCCRSAARRGAAPRRTLVVGAPHHVHHLAALREELDDVVLGGPARRRVGCACVWSAQPGASKRHTCKRHTRGQQEPRGESGGGQRRRAWRA